MGNIQNREYYDNAYLTRPEYDLHYTKSPYFELWREVMDLVKSYSKDVNIIEVGCGAGQFAHYLYDEKYIKYVGFDFSNVAILKALKHIDGMAFLCENIVNMNRVYDCGLLITLEVLEHIDDLTMLNNWHDTDIIFTVPDFDDPAHARFFGTEQDVRDRYEDHIEFESIEKFDKYFVCKGRIK